MAIGKAETLKGLRSSKKKKNIVDNSLEDDEGYQNWKATPEAERDDRPDYEIAQASEQNEIKRVSDANNRQNVRDRQKLASDLKDFSGRGALSQEMLGQAKAQAKGLGISDDQMSSFLKGNRIKASNFDSITPQKSPFAASSEKPAEQEKAGMENTGGLDARNKLAYAQEFGTPMEQYKAELGARAQDKAEGKPFQSYAKMGVGQSRSITSDVTKQVNALGRLKRKLQRRGIPLAGLNQSVAGIAGQSLMEPSITSQGYRKTEADRRISLSQRGAKRRSMLDDYLKSISRGSKTAKDIQQPKMVEE